MVNETENWTLIVLGDALAADSADGSLATLAHGWLPSKVDR